MDFNFSELMEKIAEDIGGQFSEYDKYKSVIIVPLEENRYQAVVGVLKHNEKLNLSSLIICSLCAANTRKTKFKMLATFPEP